MLTRTLFCTETALSKFYTFQNPLSVRSTKAKFDFFCKFFILYFTSRHHWETTWFRDNWQMNVHDFILYWKQLCQKFYTFKKPCWALRYKAKILIFCKFFVLHFIAATIEIQHDLGDNWQINVHKNFILYWKQLCHYFPFQNPVGAKIDKS
jgi:hypothetical protein